MACSLSGGLSGAQFAQSMGRRTVRLVRGKNVKWRKIAQYSLKTPTTLQKLKLTNDRITKTCLSTFKQLFSHILTGKEKALLE